MDADIDTAAEDPPLGLLAVAVVGLLLTAAGAIAVVLDLVGTSDIVLGVVPALTPLFDLSLFVTVLGVALFLFAMTEWSPDLDT
ncbi:MULTISPECIES: hypothetical protein [Halomicrobium]|uniref:Uncharacterized protein n=2 Tax=Halomicrobium mukohataei TaxID=57705 RepID=C7NXY6_HALMD|nr:MULTISPECIES: hypothetical protein [Halomicrobium]ACV46574.1 hypothetical protein Hmuk_0440 [Halomicrobium mukohataei DSM 12286]QCD65114.1 hypothetical protein E5139_05460 [Halomicrobium mukohataei]QFR19920.1 hypothetical protein GBQ70_05455 [Halomicrobium sp. ZPS1]